MVQRSRNLKQLVSYLKTHGYKFNVRGNQYVYLFDCEFVLCFPSESDLVLIDSLRNKYHFRVYRFDRVLLVLRNRRFQILKNEVNDVDLSLFAVTPDVLSNISANMSLTGNYIPVYRFV